jgi:hypothetical protein
VPGAPLDVVVVSGVQGELMKPATEAEDLLLDEWELVEDDALPFVDELEDDVEVVDVLR